ncbi:MAG: hypothetical protein AAGH64_01150, partial [Planctomycetota bacterium]
LLSMLIAIAIGWYVLVMPAPAPSGSGGSGGAGGQGSQQGQGGTGTSYLGNVARTKRRGDRLACAQQCRAVMQMVTLIETTNMSARSGPQDTFQLLDAFRADGSYAALNFDGWNADTPASPPIVYVPPRERGTSGVLFYEHPDNHNGQGGHIAFDGGGVKWYDWNEFVTVTGPLPRPTW